MSDYLGNRKWLAVAGYGLGWAQSTASARV
jgi:hypothetical protein